jgi:serine/threonine protein kinase/Tol biopolymer transport system component
MTLAIGTRLGPYEIISPIGAGGMGEVYRARDTRLDRIVAIKVLPDHLSSNPELRQRFEREARAVSSLNHPHICALYDVGHQDGIDYLVMEFIEGSSLSQRLENGALPTEQVLRYAIQIAGALDKAHRGGIVHRDLKPGNIIITKSGAKLLDFGLAKLRGCDSKIASSVTSLPTERHSITGQGAIIGTFQYMAPEQLEGGDADARTDIFAFGAVTYEMATGKKAFNGKSQASLITAIMSSDPAPISTIQPMIPSALDRVVKTCLAKDPDDRWQTVRDVMLQLQWIAEGRSQEDAPTARARLLSNAWLAWTLAGALLLGIIGFVWVYLMRQPAASAHVFKTSILPPEKTSFGQLALAPDGKWLAFTAATGGKVQLWVRALDSLEAKVLAGTAGASYPFWSPDSRWIGFFADGRLKKIEVSGGLAQTLSEIPNFLGATWNRDGVILFSRGGAGAIFRISATGGEAVQVAIPDRARLETNLLYPVFLPDGRHFLYTIRSGQKDIRGVYVGSLDGGVKQRLLGDATSSRYVPAPDASAGDYAGWLLFGRDDALFCQPFDSRRLQLTGEPFSISEHVGHDPKNTDYVNFSVSENGVLVFDPSANRQRRQYLWVDRGGKPAGSLDAVGSVGGPWLSPDEKRFVADRVDPQTNTIDLWLCDVTGKNAVRFTFDAGNDSSPVWSPDGRLIVWGSNREGSTDLYQKAASGAGQDTLLLKSDHTKFPTDWSRDGRFIIYRQADPKTKFDAWVLPVAGTVGPSSEMKPFSVLQTEASETAATLSPDGRWLAYASDETSRDEIYVQSFPTGVGKKQLSFGGAHSPRWRRDGKELFYYSSDGKLMAVPVESGESFAVGAAVTLFEFRSGSSGPAVVPYAVTADGQRFLLNAIVENETTAALTVVSNWTAELKR